MNKQRNKSMKWVYVLVVIIDLLIFDKLHMVVACNLIVFVISMRVQDTFFFVTFIKIDSEQSFVTIKTKLFKTWSNINVWKGNTHQCSESSKLVIEFKSLQLMALQ